MNDWYFLLVKPPLTPPAKVFSPAWAILYTTIFISLILYSVTKTGQDKSKGFWLFWLQILFNLLWSPVFFGMNNIGLALVVIIVLDILVFLTIKEFYSVSKLSALFLIPYMLWIIFATYLNIGFLVLN